jgi:hypothetical protein
LDSPKPLSVSFSEKGKLSLSELQDFIANEPEMKVTGLSNIKIGFRGGCGPAELPKFEHLFVSVKARRLLRPSYRKQTVACTVPAKRLSYDTYQLGAFGATPSTY